MCHESACVSISGHQGTIKRSHSSLNITSLAPESLPGSLQHLYDSKYCPSRLHLLLFSQAPCDLLHFVYLRYHIVPQASKIYKDRDKPTKPETMVIFTLLLSRLRL